MGKPCEVKGCAKSVVHLSRYCGRHRQAAEQNGAPTASAIRKYQVRPYLKFVDRFVKANGHHVALLTVEGELSCWLADAVSRTGGEVRWPTKPSDWRTKLDLELLRLHRASVTGLNIFRTVAALYLFAQYNPHALPPGDRVFWFACANHVLNLAPRYNAGNKSGRKGHRQRRVPAPLLENLGRDLTVRLHIVLRAMTTAIEDAEQVRAERRRKLAAALAQHPFT